MPQTSVIPTWRAGFAVLQKAQKPSNIVISVTLPATAVPNAVPWAQSTTFSARTAISEPEAKRPVVAEAPATTKEPSPRGRR
jgi:hypothetical protein